MPELYQYDIDIDNGVLIVESQENSSEVTLKIGAFGDRSNGNLKQIDLYPLEAIRLAQKLLYLALKNYNI